MTKLLLEDSTAAAMILDAGFSGEDAVNCFAVSVAEAGDYTDPRHRIDGHALGDLNLVDAVWGPSAGPMQIRSLRVDYGTGRLRDQLANLDPATCYRHAHDLWDAEGWGPWSTWNSGAYRQYLHRGAYAIGLARGVFTLTRLLYWRTGMRATNGTMLHGGDVLWVQHRVYSSADGPAPLDGWYGPDTKTHVQSYQHAHGLLVDGIVGPATLHKLDPGALWAPGA